MARTSTRPRGVTLSVLTLLWVAGAHPLVAQAASARIEGRVVDGLEAHAADGAIVQAVRISPAPSTFASVRVDAAGRFHFDSLQAGRYWLSFSSPFLDSLSVAIPEREVVLDPGATVRVDLAVPSSAPLRAALCPGAELAPSRGALLGDVMDATTGGPLAGATVVVAWNEVSVDRTTLKVASDPHSGAVAADSSGHYRLCGVPTDVPLRLQVQRGSASSAIVEAMVRERVGVLRQDLSLGDTASLPSRTGTASLSGVVTSVEGRPLAGVDLHIAGVVAGTRTDSAGRFALSSLPVGTQMLEARKVGYFKRRLAVQLREGRELRQPVALTRVVWLDSVRIVGQWNRLDDYDRRKNSHTFGMFIEAEQIAEWHPRYTSDLFDHIPGFRFENDTLVSLRSSRRPGHLCNTNIVVDGVPHLDLKVIDPDDIAAIEVYRGTTGAPVQYESLCGMVIIWTKR